MSYHLTKRRRGKKKTLWGVILIIFCAIFIAGVFMARIYLGRHLVEVDPETNCPLAGSPYYVAIVFDKTDSYNDIQKQYLKRYFNKFKETLPVHAQISIFVIDDEKKEIIKPNFIICNPESGNEANDLYENPKLIKKRWEEKYEKPLDHEIEGFLSPHTAQESPIFEIFQIVALSGFPQDISDKPKKLIMISDMLHQTDEWSHYRGDIDFNVLKKTPYYQKVRTDLQGAEVEILYVRRDNAEQLQTKRHALFWADYINSINGKVTLIERIDG